MDQIRELFSALTTNRYIGAAVIFALALAAAMVTDFVVTRVLGALTRRTKSTIDDTLTALLHRPVRTTIILFGLLIATARLELPVGVQSMTVAAIKTIIALVWAGFAMRVIGLVFENLSRADAVSIVEPRTKPLFENLARVLVVGAAIYMVFLFWNIDVTAWLASAGVVGLAVGFAAKDTLANLFSGIFILADAPYKVGDFINLDSGERGEVTHIGLRSTRLLTRDDVEVTVPNAVIANSKIVNESSGRWPKERIRIPVGVAYGSDIDHLRDVLTDIGKQHPDTCDDPEPRVRFRAFGDSSLNFELLCWIEEPVLRGAVLDALHCEIYKGLATEHIEIPYPKRDIYIKEMPKSV